MPLLSLLYATKKMIALFFEIRLLVQYNVLNESIFLSCGALKRISIHTAGR